MKRGVTVLAAAVVTVSAPAEAAEWSAGARLSAGGNYLTEPEGVPGNYEGVGFAGDAGGFGWGAGLYLERRFFGLLGLELGLSQDLSTLQREITYSGVVKVRERVELSTTRLGVLAKLSVGLPLGRVWAGLGPEFVIAAKGDAGNEFTSGGQYVSPAERARVEEMIRARALGSTLLVGGAGLAFTLGPVEVPLDLRVARNLSDESAWEDRVSLDLAGGALAGYGVAGRSSWEFRLGAGLGVGF